MTTTSQISIKALKAANLFASKESTRYYLNGVLVSVSARWSRYVATDGHRLFCHQENLDAEQADNALIGEWIFPSQAIADLKTSKYAKDAALLASFGEGKLLLQTNAETIITPVDGMFPDWRRVLPAAVDPEETNCRPQFNLAYCADFAKAAKIMDWSLNCPHFHYSRADAPCAVTFNGHSETFGAIMPVRNDAPLWAGAPDWINDRPAASAVAMAAE